MKITILEPKGYCAGVSQAIEHALKARQENPDKVVNVLGMLVHNSYVIAFLKQRDIGMIDDIADAPQGSVVVFTAHGHEKSAEEKARERKLIIYDAVCPLVKKNLTTIAKEKERGHQVIYIGYRSHPETIAALSSNENVHLYAIKEGVDFSRIEDVSPLIINQTTLNILSLKEMHEDIKKHLPLARFQDEICRATRSRQEALLTLSEDVDAIIVVGSQKSSNAKRLYEIAKEKHPGMDVFLLEDYKQLPVATLKGKKHIAISSSASTPLSIIEEIKTELLIIR